LSKFHFFVRAWGGGDDGGVRELMLMLMLLLDIMLNRLYEILFLDSRALLIKLSGVMVAV